MPVTTALPPGPRLPAALQSAQWLLGSTSLLDRCHRRYGDMFTLNLIAKTAAGPGADPSHGRWVFLARPEHVKQVFTADPDVVRTGDTNRFLEQLVGPRSILVSDEPEHMSERKLLLPPLHGAHIDGYGALMSDIAAAQMRRWPTGEPFALWPRMQEITLEVIVRAVFGISEPRRLDHVTRLLARMLNRMTNPLWLAPHAVLAALVGGRGQQLPGSARSLIDPVDDVIREEITHRRGVRDIDRRNDILSLLIRSEYSDGTRMSDDRLRDELMTLLVAGHESTATALAWAFQLLLHHPDKIARLRAEFDSGAEQYADAVVKETLRLRPVVPFVLRNLVRPLQIGDRVLPEGTWIAPCAYLIHRRADVYPQPLSFRPERFEDRPAGAYTWTPFGGGVRRCLGASFAQLEMRRVLQTVLSQAELEPARPDPETIRARFITLAPSRGARVVLRHRRTTGVGAK
ncbi:cytochrome P450 [Nocardia mexicana]|uniref:Cytochrome P450 n=1 Tax=Nocardia mexicana TaxID=279262 RepID=A0A370H842_9NOCA|nr:cytochrome P450 [Nocardia mexicana]RDI52689.1 cytochrome P450 [Nocardia mexicana]